MVREIEIDRHIDRYTHGRLQEFFQRGQNMLGAKFEIDGAGTNEGAENKNRTAKSVYILICVRFFKTILIVSQPFIIKN